MAKRLAMSRSGSVWTFGFGARGSRRHGRTAPGWWRRGAVRLNRQPTVKPHAKLRLGDVLTMALRDEVRVWRVMALASRRGPAAEARLLYEEVPEPASGEARHSNSCANSGAAAYEGAQALPWDGDAPGHDRHGSDENAVESAGEVSRTATRSAE